MRSPGDDRAVSSQIGAVLLLAIFVLAFSQYQLDVVPEQNRQTEIDHNERVAGELLELRDSITAAGYQNGTRGTTATLGTQYDSRILALNPPQPSGTLRTGDPNNVTIDGVDTDGDDTIRLESRPIVYEPDYSEYDAAPTTTIEHTAVINEFDDGVVTAEDPTLVTDDAVILPIVDGELDRTTSGSVSVEVETLETYRTAAADGDVTITLESAYPEEWAERSDGWRVENGQAVFDERDSTVDVEEVVIARLAVGDAEQRSDANEAFDFSEYGESFVSTGDGDTGGGSNGSGDRGGAYSISFDDGDSIDWNATAEGTRLELTARTDPSIDGASTDFAVNNSSVATIVDEDAETDADGEVTATLSYESDGTVTVYASSGPASDGITVQVTSAGGDGGGSGGQVYPGQMLQPVDDVGEEVETSNNVLEFEMEHTGSEEVTITEFAVDATEITTGNPIDDGNNPELEISGEITQIGEAGRNGNPDSFEADGTTYDLEADSSGNVDGQYAKIGPDDGIATIDLRSFAERLDNGGSNPLVITDSESAADVIVAFGLENGSEETFYFEQR